MLKEGIHNSFITVTGNTVIDALYMVVNKIKNNKQLDKELENILQQSGYDVNRLCGGKKLVLITGHRRENFGDSFISLLHVKFLTLLPLKQGWHYRHH